jgi:hypothetical protein
VFNEDLLDLCRSSSIGIGKSLRIHMVEIGKSVRIHMVECIILMKDHIKYIQSLENSLLGNKEGGGRITLR